MTISELKASVSLADTAAKLGIANFPSGTGKMCSPIRPGDENPSFNVYQGKDGARPCVTAAATALCDFVCTP